VVHQPTQTNLATLFTGETFVPVEALLRARARRVAFAGTGNDWREGRKRLAGRAQQIERRSVR
jgi:hypothetical protein